MPSFPLRPLSLVILAPPSVFATRGPNLPLPAPAATHSLLPTHSVLFLQSRAEARQGGSIYGKKGKNLVFGHINKAADQTQKSNIPSKVIWRIQAVSPPLVFSTFSVLLLFPYNYSVAPIFAHLFLFFPPKAVMTPPSPVMSLPPP